MPSVLCEHHPLVENRFDALSQAKNTHFYVHNEAVFYIDAVTLFFVLSQERCQRRTREVLV